MHNRAVINRQQSWLEAAYAAPNIQGLNVMSETSSFYKYSAAAQGFILWGAWGFYINSKVSLFNGLLAGLVQGIFSFIATLIVVYALTKLFNYFNQNFLKVVLPIVIIITALIVFSVLAHTIAKTPEILQTIAPNLIVSALFCSFTIYKLRNENTH